MTEQRNRCHVRRMMEDWVELYGYYEVLGVEQTEDCDHGSCVLFEIKNENEETIQIGVYPTKISVLKKELHY